ncbi:MAG TPA: hypothetical protein VN724_05935 [Pyrinomonadaceae bacterium]|nr:hypothetical protein [Pyrinomonadaceae bacterium]
MYQRALRRWLITVLDKLVTAELAEKNTPGENGKPAILRPMFNNVAMWPAGSIFSNAKDLSRWVIAR